MAEPEDMLQEESLALKLMLNERKVKGANKWILQKGKNLTILLILRERVRTKE